MSVDAEHVLPRQPVDCQCEYAVPTPGSSDRGARRPGTGRSADIYDTDDHFVSFRQALR